MKSITPPEKFSFSTKSFQIEVFLQFLEEGNIAPQGLSFFLEFLA